MNYIYLGEAMKVVNRMDCQLDIIRFSEVSHVGRHCSIRVCLLLFNGKHRKKTQQVSEVGGLLCCVFHVFSCSILSGNAKILESPLLEQQSNIPETKLS